ncbi:hypothetical protein VTH06DRAFT_4445 [Thermothelomyces fergusii]
MSRGDVWEGRCCLGQREKHCLPVVSYCSVLQPMTPATPKQEHPPELPCNRALIQVCSSRGHVCTLKSHPDLQNPRSKPHFPRIPVPEWMETSNAGRSTMQCKR